MLLFPTSFKRASDGDDSMVGVASLFFLSLNLSIILSYLSPIYDI